MIISRLVLGGIAVALMWQTMTALVIEFGSRGHHVLAIALESGMQRDSAYFHELAQTSEINAFMRSCRIDVVRATVSIRVAALQAALDAGDKEAISSAAKNAEHDLVTALNCAPTDGNAWLYLAMVEALQAGASDRTMRLLDLSHQWAPDEGWVVVPRLRFELQMAAIGLGVNRTQFRDDIFSAAAYGRPAEFARAYLSAPPILRVLFDQQAAKLPEDRLNQIRNAIAKAATQV